MIEFLVSALASLTVTVLWDIARRIGASVKAHLKVRRARHRKP